MKVFAVRGSQILFITFAFILPVIFAVNVAMAAPSEQQATDLSKSISQFSLDLYSQCVSSNSGNVIVSPYSVAVALALAAQGARGSTLDHLVKGLHLTGDKQAVAQQFAATTEALTRNLGNSTLNVANKVFVQEGHKVKKEFNDVAVKSFHSESENLNFAQNVEAAGTINQWVESKTNNKIKNLIPSDALDSDTRVVLVNAIYFKGTWEHQFEKKRTAPGPFWTSETESTDVDFMHIKEHFNFGYLENLDASAIELKYVGSDISFLVILPNKRTGLSALESSLKNVDLSDITKNMYSQEVEVTLPKFKVEFQIELKDALEKLGMGEIFANSADFGDLLESPEPLQVSKVIHKAFIDVNEEGAEAAAATALIIRKSARVNIHPPQIFKADHPFVYLIKQSENVLFIGNHKEI